MEGELTVNSPADQCEPDTEVNAILLTTKEQQFDQGFSIRILVEGNPVYPAFQVQEHISSQNPPVALIRLNQPIDAGSSVTITADNLKKSVNYKFLSKNEE